MVNYLVITVKSKDTIFSAATFIREARRKWPGCEVLELCPDFNATVDVYVDRADSSPFRMSYFPNNMISTDGTPEHAAEVAAWVRSLCPDPGVTLWCVTDNFDGHADLFPGMSASEVLENWVDHAAHNPYLEYPEYFK